MTTSKIKPRFQFLQKLLRDEVTRLLDSPAQVRAQDTGRLIRITQLMVHCYPDWEARYAQTLANWDTCDCPACECERFSLRSAALFLEFQERKNRASAPAPEVVQ